MRRSSIGSASAGDRLDGVVEALEAFLGQREEDVVLAGEVAVDRGRAVLDALGDLADGDLPVALGDEEVAGRGENGLADGVPLSVLSFLDAHRFRIPEHCSVDLMAFDEQARPARFPGAGGLHYRPCVLPTADRAQTIPPLAASALAWAVPGAGHLLLGRRQKGLIFLVALTAMFADRPAACRAGCSRSWSASRW